LQRAQREILVRKIGELMIGRSSSIGVKGCF